MRVRCYGLDKIVYKKKYIVVRDPTCAILSPRGGLEFSRNEVTKKNCAVAAKVAYASVYLSGMILENHYIHA